MSTFYVSQVIGFKIQYLILKQNLLNKLDLCKS